MVKQIYSHGAYIPGGKNNKYMIRKYIVKRQVAIPVIQKVQQEKMGSRVWGDIFDNMFCKSAEVVTFEQKLK